MESVASLAARLIRAPSPSGRESPAAAVLVAACRDLGFDEVGVDDAGNVVAVMRRGTGPVVMLNGHLDTVPLGDESRWPYPPLGGCVEEGRLWGRGASDMKSSLACMALGAAGAAAIGFRGTVLLTAVVQEEVGGLGARFLAERHNADVVILGEPSSLGLMFGHRGRIELNVSIPGRIAHAAKPELGENALLRAAAYLQRLQELELPQGGPLGGSTATPTRLITLPEDGANVVPGEAVITIDYRNLPTDPVDEVVARLAALDPAATIALPEEDARSESGGVTMRYPRVNDGYLADAADPLVGPVRESLRATLAGYGRDLAEGVWWFATDAPMLAAHGATVLGFGPGEPELAHTTRESVPIEHLEIATEAYRDLLVALLPVEEEQP